jgi:hypothetical protein
VKVWGAPSRPHWSVTIYMGDEREALDELVSLAIETHALLGERYAERRRAERTTTVHVPPRQEKDR